MVGLMNKYKSLLKCIVFCLGIVLIVAAFDYGFGQVGYVRYIIHEVDNPKENYDTIVLGASHARSAIDPQKFDDKLGTNSLSMAIPGEIIKDSYYLLKESARNNNIKKVILDIDYQYWFEPQREGYSNESFIYSQLSWTSPVKWQYLFDNMDNLDVRYAFTKRLSYLCSPTGLTTNIRHKNSQDYKDNNIYNLDVADANGPYIGKGFFSRVTNGELPGGLDYVNTWSDVAFDDISGLITDEFDKIYNYCKDNNIELICVTSPIAPSAMKILNMDVVDNKMQELFNKYDVTYYNFNKARLDVLPRFDVDFGDYEGHMGGELGEKYSEVLAQVLYDHEHGTVDMSKYFYSSFDEMYKAFGDNMTGLTNDK